jgi:hypothetical protein
MYVSKIQHTFEGEELYWKNKETQIEFGKFTEMRASESKHKGNKILENQLRNLLKHNDRCRLENKWGYYYAHIQNLVY